MSLTAQNFQFYSYNMPTRRSFVCDDSSMDVDDIDLSIPPPKPPRAFAVVNNTIKINSNTPQLAWMTSTPKTVFKETDAIATVAATVAEAVPTTTETEAAVNYLTVPDETPKSIYSNGMTKGTTNRPIKSAELLLRPKLHATQTRWSTEFIERVCEMSKHSAACLDEENTQNANRAESEEQRLQLKPKHYAGRKSWSREIREKALEMSKRNSATFDSSSTVQQPLTETNQERPIHFHTPTNAKIQKPLINATAYEKITHNSGDSTTPMTNVHNEATVLNNTFNCSYTVEQSIPIEPNETLNNSATCSATQQQDLSQTVKDRICFFNKLNSSHSNLFIDLLKNTKTTNVATVHQTISMPNTSLNTPLRPKRWSTQLELNLQSDFLPSTQLTKSQDNVATATLFMQTASKITKPATSLPSSSPPSSSLSSSSSSLSSSYSIGLSSQRKCSLRRRTSVEKSRRPILRQNSTVGSNGTKPQMHTVMEDLTLVMPVKLRVAEYERRLMMEC